MQRSCRLSVGVDLRFWFGGEGQNYTKEYRSSALHVAVGKSLHEAHKCIFLLVRKPEPSDELCIHVIGGLWRRPARGALVGVIGSAAAQDVARVVEVSDRL